MHSTIPDSGSAEPRIIGAGPHPKHVQLAEVLTELAVNELGPDAAIPSERELMSTYGVSRATVRKAIDGLVADGFLTRVHGKGTFVSKPRLESRLHLASFSQDMRRRGREPSTVLLACEEEQPPPEVARALGLADGDSTWRLSRIRLADGQPIAHEIGWHPAGLLPGLDRQDLTGSLYALLAEEYHLVIDAAEQTLWGEVADAVLARHLRATTSTPLLVFRRVSRAAGRAVEYVVSRYRGDRYQIHMSLGLGHEGPGTPAEGNPP